MFNRIKQVRKLNHRIDCLNYHIDYLHDKIDDIGKEFGTGIRDINKKYIPAKLEFVTIFDNLKEKQSLYELSYNCYILTWFKFNDLEVQLKEYPRFN